MAVDGVNILADSALFPAITSSLMAQKSDVLTSADTSTHRSLNTQLQKRERMRYAALGKLPSMVEAKHRLHWTALVVCSRFSVLVGDNCEKRAETANIYMKCD